VVAVVSGSIVLIGAGWAARDYLEGIKHDIRMDIKFAVDPIASAQRDLQIDAQEHHDAIVMLKARQAVP
jgi:hypothetical protein